MQTVNLTWTATESTLVLRSPNQAISCLIPLINSPNCGFEYLTPFVPGPDPKTRPNHPTDPAGNEPIPVLLRSESPRLFHDPSRLRRRRRFLQRRCGQHMVADLNREQPWSSLSSRLPNHLSLPLPAGDVVVELLHCGLYGSRFCS